MNQNEQHCKWAQLEAQQLSKEEMNPSCRLQNNQTDSYITANFSLEAVGRH